MFQLAQAVKLFNAVVATIRHSLVHMWPDKTHSQLRIYYETCLNIARILCFGVSFTVNIALLYVM